MQRSRLSLYYILNHMTFWSAFVVSWSFTTVYLMSKGCTSTMVGAATGIAALLSVAAQPLLASVTARIVWLNDMKNILILKLATIFSAGLMYMLFSGAAAPRGSLLLILLFMVLLLIDNCVPSLLSTVAMQANDAGAGINYGLARGLGSISYAVFSLLIGYLVLFTGIDFLMLFYMFFSLLQLIVLLLFMKASAALPASAPAGVRSTAGGWTSFFSRYPFLLPFLVSSTLLFMSHSCVNVFLINILEALGGGSGNLGTALAISAAVELPVMTVFIYLAKRFRIQFLLVISAVFFMVKALLLFLAVDVSGVYISQFFQFAAFAVYTPASVYFMTIALREQDRPMGQSLVGAFSLGLGNTFGNISGGIILDHFGLKAMILSAVLYAFLGILFMMLSAARYRHVIEPADAVC